MAILIVTKVNFFFTERSYEINTHKIQTSKQIYVFFLLNKTETFFLTSV
jgi:hypothetical protein